MGLERKINIVIFLPDFRGGGAERVMVHLAQGLREKGWQVTLLVFQPVGPYIKIVQKNKLEYHSLGIRARYGLIHLLHYLRTRRPNVVISALESANVAALTASRLMPASVRPKVIITDHNVPSVYYSSFPFLRKPHLRLFPIWGGWLYRFADYTVSVSDGAREDAIRTYKLLNNKTKTIYNPVVTQNIFQLANEEVPHHYFSQEGTKVILGIGRLASQKDFPSLIRAFKKINTKYPSRLIILGDGPERNNLIELVRSLGLQEHVDLPGFVENPYAYMSRADLFVLSSRFEGLPTVLIEALALGVPVVSTDCPHGPREILENGKWGSLVPVGNVEALSDAILRQLREPRVPKRVAWERFTAEYVVEQWDQLIRDVLSQR